MQIFECLNFDKRDKKPAQNLIEFVFVFPVLIFLTLGIFEVALFWQDVNSVYNLNAEINANLADINYKGLNLGDTCPGATKALSILESKDKMISMSDNTYVKTILDGKEPFALYKYSSSVIVNSNPQISLWVDCRNPFENGVTTQIEFYHKTLIMKATIPRFDKPEGIVIIPDNVYIASPKLNTVSHY